MTPEEWAAKEDELKKLPQVPILSPEQKVETVHQYKSLPKDRQVLLKRLLQNPCSYCEKEFNVPNVGKSHGVCERHKEEMYKAMGMVAPKNPKNKAVDLKELSPEELKLAVNLFGIVRAKEKSNLTKFGSLNSPSPTPRLNE